MPWYGTRRIRVPATRSARGTDGQPRGLALDLAGRHRGVRHRRDGHRPGRSSCCPFAIGAARRRRPRLRSTSSVVVEWLVFVGRVARRASPPCARWPAGSTATRSTRRRRLPAPARPAGAVVLAGDPRRRRRSASCASTGRSGGPQSTDGSPIPAGTAVRVAERAGHPGDRRRRRRAPARPSRRSPTRSPALTTKEASP